MTGEERAARLLRWYPAVWRDRYGEEFAELLVAEIDENPSSWRRSFDVAASGSLARLTACGLRRGALTSAPSALATAATATAVFAAAGLSLWSQLRIATTTRAAASTAVTSGTMLLTIGGGVLVVVAALALAPVIVSIARTLRRDRRGLRSLGWIAVAVADLGIGAHHFASQQALVGRGPSLGRAATLGISTYWIHPATLLSQQLPIVLWMIAGPMCFAMLVVNGVQVVRRADLSTRVRRYEAHLATMAALVMAPMTVAAAWWVIGSQSDPGTPLQAGSLDVVLIIAMALAVGAIASSRRVIRIAATS